jgi:hypothetical protein
MRVFIMFSPKAHRWLRKIRSKIGDGRKVAVGGAATVAWATPCTVSERRRGIAPVRKNAWRGKLGKGPLFQFFNDTTATRRQRRRDARAARKETTFDHLQ